MIQAIFGLAIVFAKPKIKKQSIGEVFMPKSNKSRNIPFTNIETVSKYKNVFVYVYFEHMIFHCIESIGHLKEIIFLRWLIGNQKDETKTYFWSTFMINNVLVFCFHHCFSIFVLWKIVIAPSILLAFQLCDSLSFLPFDFIKQSKNQAPWCVYLFVGLKKTTNA